MRCRCGGELDRIAATAVGTYGVDQTIRTTYSECTKCKKLYETCQSVNFEEDRIRGASLTYPYDGRLNRNWLRQAPNYKGQITKEDEDKFLWRKRCHRRATKRLHAKRQSTKEEEMNMRCRCSGELERIAATAVGTYGIDQTIRTTYSECTKCEKLYETCQSVNFEDFEEDRIHGASLTYPYDGRLNRNWLKQAPNYKGQITKEDEDKLLGSKQ